MKCVRCKHLLTKEEIDANLCWECGAIIETELVPGNAEEVQKIIESVEQEQKKQNEKARMQQRQEETGAEYGVISTIHTFFGIFAILAVVSGIFWGIAAESFLLFLVIAASTGEIYCFVRLLIAIAYLLCDIKENTSH